MTELKHYKMLIDGQWISASDNAHFESINPTTGAVWASVPEATTEDVDRAVHAADRAFNAGPWPAMSATDRGHCLLRLATLLANHSEDLGTTESTNTQKIVKRNTLAGKVYF